MKTIQWFLKTIVAGILALVIASVVCLIYYNPGIHITNKTGATDYIWQSNYFASKMTEGIAWNRTDKNGFYNETSDTDKNMNILIMGSSHMEGANVFTTQRTSYLLQKLTNKSVYNIGISGHELLTCVKNLDSALTVMQPTEYVIIETGTTTFNLKDINECLSGDTTSIPSYDSGILFQLQKIPYLKLLYAQLESWDNVANNDINQQITENHLTSIEPLLIDAYAQLANNINEICNTHNVQPIIFYHPHLTLNTNGTVVANIDAAHLEAFEVACQANNILFVDMTETFIDMYNEDHVFPHGFCNTSVGTGHLNKYGHQAIAKRLSDIISDNLEITERNN